MDDLEREAELIDGFLVKMSPVIFHRPLRPFMELGFDVCDLLTLGSCKRLAKMQQVGIARGYAWRVGDEEEAEPEPLPRSLLSPLRSLRLMLEELAADLGVQGAASLVAPAALLLLLCGIAPSAPFSAISSGLVLKIGGGASLSMKILHAGCSATLAVCSVAYYFRYSDEVTDFRWPFRVAGLTLAVSAIGQGCLAVLAIQGPDYWLSQLVTQYIASPEVAVHFLLDTVTIPLQILNIGLVSGRPPSEMLPTCMLAAASSGCQVGCEFLPDVLDKAKCLLGSLAFLMPAVVWMNALPMQALEIDRRNARRATVSTDMLSFAWFTTPWIHGLAVGNVLSAQNELRLLTLLQAMMQIGTSHIVLRSKPAMKYVENHFLGRRNEEARDEGGDP
eukprot:TRINITY_DN88584_c0_g1_i1.p1 TRINITY_DN88584_c0_g1~~TRINITY_DN88584_c0_g1_i1.p1  ORF type:complete len:422 (+),score=95.47 TRINITY_DN88584_c0_g1_i1:99-1268(+)